MSGKFEKPRRKLRLRRRTLVILIVSAALAVLSGACFGRLHSVSTCLYSQQAAERWRGENEMPFAQVSVFFPTGGETDLAGIESFHTAIGSAMKEASVEAPENGSLYTDAYFGAQNLTVATDHGTATIETLGVGGAFFSFHPLQLRFGSYLTENDYMADRVVLDEALAWTLFGSYDVAGQQVFINDLPYVVAGVVAREDDYASKKACSGDAGMFMSYEALNAIAETPISCYEVVMADPISGYARSIVEKSFSPDTNVVVENSARYDFWNLVDVLRSFSERSMQTQAVILPYWENAARLTENDAALALLLGVLSALMPAGVAAYWAVYWLKKGFLSLKDKTVQTIERRSEEKKEKHYVRGGI